MSCFPKTRIQDSISLIRLKSPSNRGEMLRLSDYGNSDQSSLRVTVGSGTVVASHKRIPVISSFTQRNVSVHSISAKADPTSVTCFFISKYALTPCGLDTVEDEFCQHLHKHLPKAFLVDFENLC